MTPRPILLSWSSGKDCAHALSVLEADPAVDVRALLTTLDAVEDRIAMHGVRRELLVRQARAIGRTVYAVQLPWPCSNDQYEKAMLDALEPVSREGIEAVAFGDLFLEDIRAYREQKNEVLGLDSLFPLWGRNTLELAHEMIASGVRARVACVDTRVLPPELVGREYDAAFLEDLPPGTDPCGENGEFHTFAWDGPCFHQPVPVRAGEVFVRDTFAYIDLIPED